MEPDDAGRGTDPAREREAELVRRARAGDREAFEALVRDAFPALVRFTNDLAGRDRGPDLAQEALLRALRAMGRFRGEAKFRSWLLRIARNAWFNERALLRSKKERSAGETLLEGRAGEERDPTARLQQEELLAHVERELGTLPEEQRTAMLLCDREGMSYKEIAEVMGTPVGTVMSRIHYARSKLRQRLGHLTKEGRS
jgi:RNA polymerase sigma-70 factor (ECF subfamily)